MVLSPSGGLHLWLQHTLRQNATVPIPPAARGLANPLSRTQSQRAAAGVVIARPLSFVLCGTRTGHGALRFRRSTAPVAYILG
jgi:hypothetical protein